jgi:hypothetical protein
LWFFHGTLQDGDVLLSTMKISFVLGGTVDDRAARSNLALSVFSPNMKKLVLGDAPG